MERERNTECGKRSAPVCRRLACHCGAGCRPRTIGAGLDRRGARRLLDAPWPAQNDPRAQTTGTDRRPCRSCRWCGADQPAGWPPGCQLFRRRCRMAQLCRPLVSTALGRCGDRHRGRVTARPVAALAGGRRGGRQRRVQPRQRIEPRADHSCGCGPDGHPPAAGVGAVRAWRVHRRRHRQDRPCRRDLRLGPACVRFTKNPATALFRARRHQAPVLFRAGRDAAECGTGHWIVTRYRLYSRRHRHIINGLGDGCDALYRLAQYGRGGPL